MIFRKTRTHLSNNLAVIIGPPRGLHAADQRKPAIIVRWMIALSLIVVLYSLGAAHASAQADPASESHHEDKREVHVDNTLLVWAGDKAHVAPDFLAVIDFDEHSPHYGKVIRTVPLTGPAQLATNPTTWGFRLMVRRSRSAGSSASCAARTKCFSST